MEETLIARFQSEAAPNPHDVAQAIAKLVEQSNGSHPARTVVGQSFGTDAINAQADVIQAQLLDGLGLHQLADRATSRRKFEHTLAPAVSSAKKSRTNFGFWLEETGYSRTIRGQ
jgi:hypothetical protein